MPEIHRREGGPMFDARWPRNIITAGAMALALAACARREATAPPATPAPSVGAYHANILDTARSNTAYRRVIFTGVKSQLVVMSIPPGGDIGEEQHERVEQILFCAEGSGRAIIN